MTEAGVAFASPRSQSAIAELRAHWSTLAGTTLGAAFGAAALPFYTGGLFLTHFEQDFGWTRTQLTAISLIGTPLIALASPIAGAIFDRIGVQLPAAVGYVALALSFFYVSQMHGSLAEYAVVTLSLGVLMIGTGPVGLTRPVNMAFDSMRGLALGVMIGGIGITAAIAPPLVGEIIATDGWRAAFRAMSLAVAAITPVILLLLSWRPPTAPAATILHAARQSVRPILRGVLFWRLGLAFLLVALAVSGFITHFVPMLTDGGMPPLEAARIAGLLGAAVLVGRVGVGLLVDRLFAPYVATAVMLVAAMGFAMLALGGGHFAIPGASAIGLAMGAEVDLIAYMTARYYGMQHYGRLYGMLYGVFALGVGASPYFISLIQAAGHSYVPALWMSVSLLVIVALLFATAPHFPTSKEPA